jgi:hypothetical protein
MQIFFIDTVKNAKNTNLQFYNFQVKSYLQYMGSTFHILFLHHHDNSDNNVSWNKILCFRFPSMSYSQLRFYGNQVQCLLDGRSEV